MTKKEASDVGSKRLSRYIRPAKHGMSYYLALFVVFFVIPFYVLLQFFYPPAGGWSFFDLIFISILALFSVNELYKEFGPKTKRVWFIMLGVICGIAITILTLLIK